MKKAIVLFLCLCFFIVGCQPSPDQKEDTRVVMGDFVLYKHSKHSDFPVFTDAYYLLSYPGNDREVTLPQTAPDGLPILAVDVWAFSECETIEKLTIPEGYTAILPWAFQSCKNLKEIYIGKDVNDISQYGIFDRCNALSLIEVDTRNETYYSKENCILTRKDNVLLAGCKASKIPEEATQIGAYAFYEIESLSSIEIPGNIQKIGEFAFFGCAGLDSIEISDTVDSIEYSAFGNCASLTVYCQMEQKPESWHTYWDGSDSNRYPSPTVRWK
ncbi:MAG: leucine-rich repeat domain-containing protein [Clostridia bacterium]|nr:leucine-rich repeat domain-containing protein [Clostridia bacterium]